MAFDMTLPGVDHLFDGKTSHRMGPGLFKFVVGAEKFEFLVHKSVFEHVSTFKDIFTAHPDGEIVQEAYPVEAFSLLVFYAYHNCLASRKPVTSQSEMEQQQHTLVKLCVLAESCGWAELFDDTMHMYKQALKETDQVMSPESTEYIANISTLTSIPLCIRLASDFALYSVRKNLAGTKASNPCDSEDSVYSMGKSGNGEGHQLRIQYSAPDPETQDASNAGSGADQPSGEASDAGSTARSSNTLSLESSGSANTVVVASNPGHSTPQPQQANLSNVSGNSTPTSTFNPFASNGSGFPLQNLAGTGSAAAPSPSDFRGSTGQGFAFGKFNARNEFPSVFGGNGGMTSAGTTPSALSSLNSPAGSTPDSRMRIPSSSIFSNTLANNNHATGSSQSSRFGLSQPTHGTSYARPALPADAIQPKRKIRPSGELVIGNSAKKIKVEGEVNPAPAPARTIVDNALSRAGPLSAAVARNDKYKTKRCKYHRRGTCTQGEYCRYIHED